MLGAAGAAAGLALAPVVANVLVRLMTNSDPGSEPYSTSIDARVLLFTLGISFVVSLLFSIAPVLHFLRPDLAQALCARTREPQRKARNASASLPWARRLRSASCCSAARACLCARSTTFAISR